ncbi:MAG: thiol protease/hemagglutinin PrtT [Muribaculaceae bacterium]|nr:thiol protease/hemagglutinin PrtT [Muribaculaceae bacterium]
MKKTTLGLLMMLLTGYGASARQISPDEAKRAASDFLSTSELKTASSNTALRPMKAPGVNADGQTSPFYVFNHGENEGFVIVSGDDRAPKILGYSDKGSFDSDNLPPQLKAMMEQWATQMANLSEAASEHSTWTNASSTRSSEVLLETANWGQYAPFNDLCPIVDGEKAPAGCVATAMSIVMKYHNWPDCTRGGEEYDYYFPDEKFDFDNYAIDWDALSEENNPDFAAQAAKLTYSAGIAAQMMYGSSESSAESWAVDHSFIYFYAYSKNCQFLPRGKFEDNEWNDILRTQLEEIGPVVYSGFGSGGHTFVVDGYDSAGLYHVNWGWNGNSNGYFTLEFSLDNGMRYNEGQGMIINILPDKTKKEYSKVWFTNADAYDTAENDAWNFLNPDILEGVPNTYISPNLCIANFRGFVRVAIADEDDKIVGWADDIVHQKDGYRFNCPHPGGPIMAENKVMAPLKEGQRYQLFSQEVPNSPESPDDDYQPAYQPSDNPEDWQMVVGGIKKPSCFYASGNRSRTSEIRFHIAENLPSYCSTFNSYEKEFSTSLLRGFACPVIFHMPEKGISYEMNSSDKDGSVHDVLYVEWGDDNDSSFHGYNFSMLADQIDVYFRYDEEETRRDNGIPSDEIVENDGLVYRISDDALALIGYDEIGDNVRIPESIRVGDKELPVRFVSDMALAFAPVKNLDFESKSLEFGKFAFAGTSRLESVSVNSMTLPWDHFNQYGFVDSSLSTVFFDSAPSRYMVLYFTGYSYELNMQDDKFYGVPSVKNLNFVVTSTPADANDMDYFLSVKYFRDIMPVDDVNNAFNSYMIPGLGNTKVLSIKDELPFNINQMWSYDIDRRNSLIRIGDILPNVRIESVLINGSEAKVYSDGVYFGGSGDSGMDVTVNYIVNGIKKTTNYSPEYNESVESTDLSGVDGNFIKDEEMLSVYTLDGVLVSASSDRTSLKSLTPGIYIIRQGNEMKKLIIR